MKGLAITQRQPQEPAGGRQERGPGQRPQPALRRLPVARPAAVRQHELVQRPQLLRRPEGPRRRHARGRLAVLQDLLRAQQRRARRRRRLRAARRRTRGSTSTSTPIPPSALPREARHLGAAPGEGEAGDEARQARDAARARDRLPRARSATRPSTTRWGSSTRSSSRARTAALYQALVQKSGLTGDVDGGINSGLGNMYNINGPTLWDVSLFYDKDKTRRADPDGLRRRDRKACGTKPVDQATLDRALVKMRSDLYDKIEQTGGFGKADLLASFALFDDDPAQINQIEAEFRKVTPELMQKTAQEYLRPENRTILLIEPKAEAKPAAQERIVGRRRPDMKTPHRASLRAALRRSPLVAAPCGADKQSPPPPAQPKGFAVPKPAGPSRSTTAWPSRSSPTARSRRSPCAWRPRRKRQREGQQVWLADLDRRHADGGHGDAHRLADRRGRREDGRLARRHRRREPHRDRRRRPLGVRPRHGRARRRRRPPSEVPGVGARAPEDRPAARSSRSRGASRSRSRRRSSARCSTATTRTAGSSRPRRCSRATPLAHVRGFYDKNFGAARSHLYVVGRFDDAAVEAAVRKAFVGWKKGAAPHLGDAARPKSERAVYIVDRPGAVQSTINLGMPVIDPSKPDWDALVRHERPARRLVRLAHHLEHPRAEGLHVLAVRPALEPLPRRLLGRGRRRHDQRHGPRHQGDPRRDRPPPGGAAVRGRSSRDSRTTAPASSSSRTRRGRESSDSSSSWTCTACRPTT